MLSQTALLQTLQRRFKRGLAGGLQITDGGIWVPTPLDVVVGAVQHLERWCRDAGLERPVRVLDAGSGDGRWVAAVALWSRSAGVRMQVLGAELDPSFHHKASEALEELAPGSPDVGLCCVDYLAPGAFEGSLWGLAEADVVLNYPDGHEEELGAALRGSSAELWLISSQIEIHLEALALVEQRLIPRPGVSQIPWRLSIFKDEVLD